MSVEKLTGTRTLGGHFKWDTTYEENKWEVQHHKTRFLTRDTRSYRLLDPHNRLMASADTEEEIKEYLHQVMKH